MGRSTTRPGSGPARRPSTLAIAAALVALYLVWGSTYLAIRIAVGTIPPFLMVSLRFFLAGAALYAWEGWQERGLPRASIREWRDSAIVAAGLLGGGMGLVAWGEQTVSSGMAALLVAMMPVWLSVFGRLLFGDRFTPRIVAGIGIGLVGVALLVWPGEVGALSGPGVIALVLSPMSWALGSLFSARRARLPSRPLLAAGLQMLAAGGLLGLAAIVTGELGQVRPAAVSADSLVALGYLVLIGSLVGYTAYGWLLRVAPLPLISTYAYVNPVVAFILGAGLLGEPITPRTIIASVVIVTAVALIITGRSAGPRRAADPGGQEPVSRADPPPGPSAQLDGPAASPSPSG